jgi:hypothetical protein
MRGQQGILADHLPPRRNRGRKVAKIKVAARTLLNHRVSKALESVQSRDLPFLRPSLCRPR